jgi:hypothetical protein
MRNRLHPRRVAAILACTASLAGTATALAPGTAAAAPAASNCGSKSIKVPQKGSKTVYVAVSRIRVEGGATCAEAFKVIRGAVTKNLPSGWTLGRGKFKVPEGLTAQVAVNGHKKVEFALVGR